MALYKYVGVGIYLNTINWGIENILGMLAASGYWLFWFIVYGKEGFKTFLLNYFSIILKYIYNFLLKWCNKLYNKYKIYLLYNLLHHLLLNFFKVEF